MASKIDNYDASKHFIRTGIYVRRDEFQYFLETLKQRQVQSARSVLRIMFQSIQIFVCLFVCLPIKCLDIEHTKPSIHLHFNVEHWENLQL